jgi:hypothetical protein
MRPTLRQRLPKVERQSSLIRVTLQLQLPHQALCNGLDCYSGDHCRYAAAVPPVFSAPEEICFTNNINMFNHYLNTNIELACKHASLTWGNQSSTIMALNTIDH